MDSPFFFESTEYWSNGDEQAHFEWLGRIRSIREIKGVGQRLYLSIDPDSVTLGDAEELQAIHRRYGGDLTQLKAIEKNDA